MHSGMKTTARLRHGAVAALAIGAFWLPMRSAAHADQQSTAPHLQPLPAPTDIWAGTSFERRCAWPYRNQLAPCMSTWPEGDPNYHGSRPGPTFRR